MSLRSFTLRDVIHRNANIYGLNTAFVFGEKRVTHAEYARKTVRLAAGLTSVGVKKGDRLAILAQNCIEYVDLLGAAAHIGAILVPINWRLSADEVAYVIQDVSPSVLVVADELKHLLPQHCSSEILIYLLEISSKPILCFNDLYSKEGMQNSELPCVDDENGLIIIYTAAVTGRPRGAILSHRGLIAASMQFQMAFDLNAEDVNLGVLPLFHVIAYTHIFASQLAGGATVLFSRFDPQTLVKVIEDELGSVMGTFPPMLSKLLDAAAEQDVDLGSLRVLHGIDVPETIARLHSCHPRACFWTTYGQTETSSVVSLGPYSDKPGSAGRPTTQVTVIVVDDLDRPLPVGTVGEIVVRGPTVFSGYWGNGSENAFTFRNGWLHTGDMGNIDDEGYLWFRGRSLAKELIKPGGENVYPAEVERVILEHPAVSQVVVVGVADEQWGEAVKALCVLKHGHTITPGELQEFVGARIARFKKPKHVFFVQALPRTAAGLVDREAAKDLPL